MLLLQSLIAVSGWFKPASFLKLNLSLPLCSVVSSFGTFKTLWSRVLVEVTCPIYTRLEKTASRALEALWGFLSSDAQMWLPVVT